MYLSDPEEIYLVKKNGDVVTYDATKKTEQMKIKNPINNATNAAGKYSLVTKHHCLHLSGRTKNHNSQKLH